MDGLLEPGAPQVLIGAQRSGVPCAMSSVLDCACLSTQKATQKLYCHDLLSPPPPPPLLPLRDIPGRRRGRARNERLVSITHQCVLAHPRKVFMRGREERLSFKKKTNNKPTYSLSKPLKHHSVQKQPFNNVHFPPINTQLAKLLFKTILLDLFKYNIN